MSLVLSEPNPIRRAPWGTLASLCAHLGLGALLLAVATARPLQVEPPQSIAVDLVPAAPVAGPAEVPALSAPLAPTAAPQASAPAATAGRMALPPADDLIHTTPSFATSFLKDPANAKLRKTLSTFAPSERQVQLCNMEGLEQIHRRFPKYDPDVLVSYAMADPVVTGLTLAADGGAFHAGRNWYAIRFRCTIAADYSGVTGFDFAIGAPIPRSEWDSHNLPEQYEDSE